MEFQEDKSQNYGMTNLIGKDRHQYPFDYNYFELIDTTDKAYFLGLLASDGNVFKRSNKNSQSIIKLSLQQEDKIILEIFKAYLDSQQLLYIHEKINNNYTNNIYTLELVSDKMADDLFKYNIVQHKTYEYSFVKLADNLMPHFFRGYFDGDGSIYCVNDKYHSPSKYNISISGFVHNLTKMKDYLTNIGINSIVVLDKRNEKYYKCSLPFGNLTFTSIN